MKVCLPYRGWRHLRAYWGREKFVLCQGLFREIVILGAFKRTLKLQYDISKLILFITSPKLVR